MTELKILVCGDVEGHFRTLFTKIGILQKKKKGPFEYLLCVGNFFGSNNDEWTEVQSGKIAVPLTTYILGPNKREHLEFYPDDSSELAPNLIYLGKKRGLLTGSSGLKIAYLSGFEQKKSQKFSFSEKDITELLARVPSGAVDILLTSQWPREVTKYAKSVDDFDSTNIGSSLIAFLAKVLKPRYHFSGISGVYYERLPYRNHQVLQEMPIHPTRFIGLAPVNNDKNLKWLYAFSMNLFDSSSLEEWKNITFPVTECPYGAEECTHQKRKNTEIEGRHKKQQNLNVSQESCWFCFTNPDIEKQLLLSIGYYSYITLAKGGLVKDHLLIIPMEHVPASINLCESSAKEIQHYKDALVEYLHNQDQDVIFFERNLKVLICKFR
ncbi:CWF19-like protein 1 [Caerostris extrusa]|uniref:CWF19-like protein 1 n=1 Tax=Caerostris extrusa TaxID=172846 RepID=A0AAV4ML76_CAEEX|nr:CWF19-like protein 1 [Caerostris extrusa]